MAQIEALLRTTAEACEHAKRRRCTCQCGGALHGQSHTEKWIDETAQKLYNEQIEETENGTI